MSDPRGPFFLTEWERQDYERQQRGEPPLGPLGSAEDQRRNDALALADDAIALLDEWDKKMWDGPGRRVMDADLADLYRRRRAMGS